jgi:hypothetical protein
MRIALVGIFAATALVLGCDRTTEAPPPTAEIAQAPDVAYTPIAIDEADEPGTPRQVRCQIGDAPEQDCTLTPLFGDDSFQLDGENVALRMVVTGNEGGLFEVFGPEHRVPMAGVYRRSSPSDPCWVADDAAGPSPICIR